jgi:hypothetical protein
MSKKKEHDAEDWLEMRELSRIVEALEQIANNTDCICKALQVQKEEAHSAVLEIKVNKDAAKEK